MTTAAMRELDARMVRVDDVELHCESAGAGEPMLLIHGLGSCTEDWRPQIAHFSHAYRVIAFDLRGHGRSSKPRGAYSIDRFARDTEALMDALNIGPSHIVGISLGGMVAFQLAVNAPQRVKTLTIVNSGPAVPAETFKQRIPLYIRLAYLHLLGLPRMARMLVKRLFPKPEQEDLRRAFVARLSGNDKRCYLASLKAIFNRWSVAAHLKEIRCPTLVIAADQDYSPVAAKEAYVAAMPDARLVVVPDSHHALPMEKPREFNQALEDFLTPLAGRSGAKSVQAVL